MKLLHLGGMPRAKYDGLRVHAVPGVHEAAAARLQGVAKPPAFVLDVACGEGAFMRRLTQLGYQVSGMDLVDDAKGNAPAAEVRTIDLDDPAALREASTELESCFDAVVSLETIEHLRPPWMFLDFCSRVLRPNGHLILYTPNVSGLASRMLFLYSGRFMLFGDENAQTMGHINPLPSWEIDHILESTGLFTTSCEGVGSIPLVWLQPSLVRTAQWLLSMMIGLPLYPLLKGPKKGWVLLYTARKRGL